MANKRRQRLLIAWGIVGVTLLGAALFGGVTWLARRHAPVVAGQEVAGLTDALKRQLPPGYPDARFVDVSERAGVHFVHSRGARTSLLPEDMGPGAAWGDYDGDGDLDLYVTNHPGPWTRDFVATPDMPANALYRNNGDGTFTDVAPQAGVDLRAFGMGAAWGDYDGDGRLDLFVSNVGRNVLFHNNGDGTFTNVTAQAGVGDEGFGATVSWVDYDRDGRLDVYVTNYVEFVYDPNAAVKSSEQFGFSLPFTINPSSYKPGKNRLYHNNGNGTFTNVAPQLGVEDATGRSLSAAWADFDNDGWPDLYVANDVSNNALYRNDEGKRFQDIGAKAWVAEYRGSMGLAIGDVDDDGDLDIFISHWLAQENSLYRNLLFEGGGRALHFTDIADMVGLGAVALQYVGWGTELFDLDNDTRLDLVVINGSTLQDPADPAKMVPQRNFLFWNKGKDEGFFEIGDIAGPFFTTPNIGRAAALADYDEDGRVDIFVTRNHGPAVLLHNETVSNNHWVTVRLCGPRGNPTGIGARIRAVIGDKTYLREVGSSPSYLGQSSPDAHFGLGTAAALDALEVNWPDGTSQRWEHVAGDAFVIATHGSSDLVRQPPRRGS